MTAANAEPVLATVAPKPHADRFTASTITDEQLDALYAERDRLRAGEEPHLDDRIVASPAQWIWRWNRASPAERLAMAARVQGLYAERDQLAVAIVRVREVHARVKNAHTDSCMHCSERDYPDYEVAWPCPTIAALDGPSPAPATPAAAPESHTGLRGAPGAPGGPR